LSIDAEALPPRHPLWVPCQPAAAAPFEPPRLSGSIAHCAMALPLSDSSSNKASVSARSCAREPFCAPDTMFSFSHSRAANHLGHMILSGTKSRQRTTDRAGVSTH